MAGKKKKEKWTTWKPSQPDPAIFQIPKPASKDTRLRITNPGNQSVSKEKQALSDTSETGQEPDSTQSLEADASENASSSSFRDNIEQVSKSPGPKSYQKDTENTTSGGKATNPGPSNGGSQWRPDIYVHSFVPEAYLAINQSPAIPISTPAVGGIDFDSYVATFTGTYFRLLPRKTPLPQLHEQMNVKSLDNLSRLNLRHYFETCLASDLEAQIRETKAYDLFGVFLGIKDLSQQSYTLRVSGLREGTPAVTLGDTVMLRQLIMDPATKLPQGMTSWLMPGGGREKGHPAPGFTGYQISAVVQGVDKINEIIIVRAPGLILTGPLVCNVCFVVQARTVEALQSAVIDVAQALDSKTERTWLYNMLFPDKESGIVQTTFPSVVFPQTWLDQSLNYEQKKAVNAVHSRNYGELPYIINGPPGTGKTKLICEIIGQFATSPDFLGSILLCAPSNSAADTLADRLRTNFDPKAMLRLNNYSRTFAEVPQTLLHYCYVEGDIFHLPPLPILMGYKIVVTTCRDADILVQARVTNRDLVNLQRSMTTTLNPFHHRHGLLSPTYPLHWAALVVDEAAQATEPETMIPLSVVMPPDTWTSTPTPIFVMAGDQHQLNPRTYNKSTTLQVSFFERLSNAPLYASHPLARKNLNRIGPRLPMLQSPFVNLIRNYRSHPAILAVPSSLFYNNTLIPEATRVDSLLTWSGWYGRGWPILFECNSGIDDCEDVQSIGGGWYNVFEAAKAITYAQDLLKSGMITEQRDICIMSPFASQVRLLRKRARSIGLMGLNIGPTQAFQGLESRFVILCTTRARRRFMEADQMRGIGIIEERKKFNVAITRAKEGLIVIGNPFVLATDSCWLAFMKFCWRNSLWQTERDHDPKMRDLMESKVNDWIPPEELDQQGNVKPLKISGLEAALVYKEREKWQGSKAAKRFMSGDDSQEDAMWRTGLQAEEEVEDLYLEGRAISAEVAKYDLVEGSE